jgi:hypothetical protein
MKQIVLFLISLILLISCENDEVPFDKSIINSYQEADEKCVRALKRVLKPIDFERDGYEIEKVYKLEVSFDSSIYKNSIWATGLYIGISYKNDSLGITYLCLFPYSGQLRKCVIADHKFLVNNCWFFGVDMRELGSNNCFELSDTMKLRKLYGEEIGYWSHYGTNGFQGKWELESNQKKFSNDTLNNTWNIKKSKIIFTDFNGDTILSNNYSFDHDSLILKNTNFQFQVLTYTDLCIVLKEYHSEETYFLYKVNE